MAAIADGPGLPPGLQTVEIRAAALKVPPQRGQTARVVVSFVVTRLVTEPASVQQAVVEAGRAGPVPPDNRPEA